MKMKKDLWVGLNEHARKSLVSRDYKTGSLGHRIANSGVDAGDLTAPRSKVDLKKVWIPGVRFFREQFIRSAIAAVLASWCANRRESLARSDCGRNNGQ